MSKPFNYSKWDNIELSDDEEDVHPNIDKASWFRLKHRTRVEREEKEEADKKKIRSEMAVAELRISEILLTLQKISQSKGDAKYDDDDDELEDKDGLEAELAELRLANKARQDKLDHYEKTKKWNVDNMCHVVEERTLINDKVKSNISESGYVLPDPDLAVDVDVQAAGTEQETQSPTAQSESTEPVTQPTVDVVPTKQPSSKPASSTGSPTTAIPAASAATKISAKTSLSAGADHHTVSMLSYHEFTEKYAHVCEEFMTLKSLDESRDFLIEHGSVMLQENASNYLLLASLEDEMNGFREKMRLTARQSQLVSSLADLAKSLKAHPGNVIVPFFKRLEEREHFQNFMVGVESFIENLIKRAVVKKKEMDEERAKTQGVDLANIPKEERLGPGGLDPMEVFESLPEAMQEAFESRDTEKLKQALMNMSESEAEYHMKRCVDSGLWNE